MLLLIKHIIYKTQHIVWVQPRVFDGIGFNYLFRDCHYINLLISDAIYIFVRVGNLPSADLQVVDVRESLPRDPGESSKRRTNIKDTCFCPSPRSPVNEPSELQKAL